ncbi:hypothetical protein BDZ90DRAFT_146467 [Jaminaea rosea]|uniref:Uncharacterized protein n=1 Tax=Jaminaea rosea TaxID=1569628 RepID=A0A316UTP0_9BASI|nr:hypothetical protein BDZ90DRAFT_146467 [Jaminaea rosea]PWN28364.1 hypothetical protein BDZ90DRAFT_146467 [Jaminaea rosea]
MSHAPRSRQEAISSSSVAALGHFVRLMDNIKGEWANVVAQVHQPTTSLTQLQLETVAFMRGLHGNASQALDVQQSHASSSRDTLDSAAAMSARRVDSFIARQTSREVASTRLLSLEGDLVDLRGEMERLYSYSQTMMHAASSVVNELDHIHGHVGRLKTAAANTKQVIATPGKRPELDLTATADRPGGGGDTPSSSHSQSASESEDNKGDESEREETAYLEELLCPGPFSVGPEYGEEDDDDENEENVAPRPPGNSDELISRSDTRLRGGPAFGEGMTPASASGSAAGTTLPEAFRRSRRQDYFGDWNKRGRHEPAHLDIGPASKSVQMNAGLDAGEDEEEQEQEDGLLCLGLKRGRREREIGPLSLPFARPVKVTRMT